jgi:hypothetical protein
MMLPWTALTCSKTVFSLIRTDSFELSAFVSKPLVPLQRLSLRTRHRHSLIAISHNEAVRHHGRDRKQGGNDDRGPWEMVATPQEQSEIIEITILDQ